MVCWLYFLGEIKNEASNCHIALSFISKETMFLNLPFLLLLVSELHNACQKLLFCKASWWPKLLFKIHSKKKTSLKLKMSKNQCEAGLDYDFGDGLWEYKIDFLPVCSCLKEFKNNSWFFLSLELVKVNSSLSCGIWEKLLLQPMHMLWVTICSKPNLNKVRL